MIGMDNRIEVVAKKPSEWMAIIQGLWRRLGNPGEFFMQGALGKEKTLPFVSYRTIERTRHQQDGKRAFRNNGYEQHPDIPGQFIERRTKMFVSVLEFEIQAKTAGEAEDLMERLEDLLDDYRDQLAQAGVQHVEFIRQGEDEVSSEGAEPYAKRRLYYGFSYTQARNVIVSDIESAYVSTRVQDNKGG